MHRIPALAASLMVVASTASAVPFQPQNAPASGVYDQVLDNPQKPLYGLEWVNLFESDVDDFGDTTVNELKGHWEFAYYRIPDVGHVAVAIDTHLTLFQDSAGIALPDELLKLALDGTLTWRTDHGVAYELGFEPGLYSDFEDFGTDGFAFPFSVRAVRSFLPELSGVAGLEIRPEFDTVVRPHIWIAWLVSDYVWLQLMIPESRAVWTVNSNLRAHFGVEWNSVDYHLGDQPGLDRDQISMEDIRFALGLSFQMSDLHHFTIEVGQAIERSIDFEDDAEVLPSDFDFEDAAFLRFSLGGPF